MVHVAKISNVNLRVTQMKCPDRFADMGEFFGGKLMCVEFSNDTNYDLSTRPIWMFSFKSIFNFFTSAIHNLPGKRTTFGGVSQFAHSLTNVFIGVRHRDSCWA